MAEVFAGTVLISQVGDNDRPAVLATTARITDMTSAGRPQWTTMEASLLSRPRLGLHRADPARVSDGIILAVV